MQKNITLELTNSDTFENADFDFVVDTEKYHKLQNSLMGKDKVTPMHNFAINCCVPEQRKELAAYFLAADGLATQVAGELVDNFLPKIEVTVKKPKSGPNMPPVAV